MTSVFSWQLCQPLPCFILYSKAKLACYSRYLLTSYFCILVPHDEKDIFFWFTFFGISGWGIDLDYYDIEWFALEMNRDHFVIFEIAPNTAFQTLLLTMRPTPFLLRNSCPQQQIQWSSEINSLIPVHFSSLIPKMLIFTLALSCLTTSKLPWFMELTFQVPMQYCSLQHQTLLPSPVTSTAGCCFHFGSVSSFFLELFLHSSPVAYWAAMDLGSSYFTVISFCPFVLFKGFSRQEHGSGMPFTSAVDHILSELCTMTHPFWVALHGMSYSFIVRQGCGPCDQFGQFSVIVVLISVCPLMNKNKRLMEAS